MCFVDSYAALESLLLQHHSSFSNNSPRFRGECLHESLRLHSRAALKNSKSNTSQSFSETLENNSCHLSNAVLSPLGTLHLGGVEPGTGTWCKMYGPLDQTATRSPVCAWAPRSMEARSMETNHCVDQACP